MALHQYYKQYQHFLFLFYSYKIRFLLFFLHENKMRDIKTIRTNLFSVFKIGKLSETIEILLT